MAASRCWGCLAALACTLASPRVAKRALGQLTSPRKCAPRETKATKALGEATRDASPASVWTCRTLEEAYSMS